MATHRAIEATCQAVIELLRDNYRPADFNRDLEFAAFTSARFGEGLTAGVSLYLYRVTVNNGHRTPPGRRTATGQRMPTQLPLDLGFMLTTWGQEVSLQHAIAGWMMRTVEDHPVLTTGLLNRRTADVFRSDETVELVLADMVTEDLMTIWERLGTQTYQLSIPYIARNVWIESILELDEAEPVRDRVAHYGAVPQP